MQTKALIREWERKFPGRIDNIFNAMGRVTPSHLMDRSLYPFATLQAGGVADPVGDKAFDDDEACADPAVRQAGTGLRSVCARRVERLQRRSTPSQRAVRAVGHCAADAYRLAAPSPAALAGLAINERKSSPSP